MATIQTPSTAVHILEIRSQKSRGSSAAKFGGPDLYVAVQSVPAGVPPLIALNRKAAERRGITLTYFGEGYSRHQGKRSMLGQAIAAARQFIAEQQS